MAEYIGGKAVVGYTIGLSGLLTALTPLSASISFWAVFSIRVMTGILGGVLYPALHSLISMWAPPDEKGKFVSALLGGTFGTVLTWPIAGIITEQFGWVYAFYVPAAITFFCTFIWFYIVYDTPAQHPRINKAELEHIQQSLGDSISKKKVRFS